MTIACLLFLPLALTYGPIPLIVKIAKSSITGNVGIANATIRAKNNSTSEEMTIISSSDGSYSLNLLTNATYTVTPEKAGYTFSPVNASVIVGVMESKNSNVYCNVKRRKSGCNCKR